MARGSARQRKKIAKRLAKISSNVVAQETQPKVRVKSVNVTPVTSRIVAPKEELPTTKRSATVKQRPKKKKRINRKQRKRLKLQQKRLQQGQYRGKAQEQYYRENPDKEYTNEVIDMTDEYANEVLNSLNKLNDYYSGYLTNLFYSNYNRLGTSYIQTLHDSGAIEEINEAVEYLVACYKGNVPEAYLKQFIDWLNLGLPVDASILDTEDSEDITSEFYE